MTRIENAASFQDKEALKKEIRREIKVEERRKKLVGCGGCLLLALVVICVPLFLVAPFFAKTGFVEVPLLTRAVYRPSAPMRDVAPFSGETSDQVLAVLPHKITYDVAAAQLRLPISEQEFTTVMQRVATMKPSQLPFAVSRMQMVIEPNQVEVFAVSPRHGRDVTVRIRLVPRVRDGQLVIESPQVLLGGEAVPHFLAQPFFDYFAKSMMDQLRGAMDSVGRLVDIKLSEGAMTFVFFRQ